MSDMPPAPRPTGPLRRLVLWAKDNPALAAMGSIATLVASLVGIVSALPAAWTATCTIAGWPVCFIYPDVYHYADGAFTRTAPKAWHEVNTHDRFDFTEVLRTRDYVLLHNLTPRPDSRWPTMIVRLPACGGTAQWTYENPQQWVDLFEVWR